MDITDAQLNELYTYIILFSKNSLKERPKDNCNALNADATLKLLSARDSINERNNSRRRRMYDTAMRERTDYYTFDIKEFGWYNCDRFLESVENVIPQIALDIPNKTEISQTIIIIPKLKAIIPCEIIQNRLTNSWVEFRFPRNEKAVIVFENNKDRKQTYFYKTLVLNEKPVTIKIDAFNKEYKEIEKELSQE